MKPANILITKQYGGLTVKLSDFGCAKVLPKTIRKATHFTSPSSPPIAAHHPITTSTNTNSTNSIASVKNLTTITEDSEDIFMQHEIAAFVQEFTPNYHTSMENALTDYLGSRRYRAPEMLGQSVNYHFEVDIWALGCSMVEFVKHKSLFKGKLGLCCGDS